MNKILEVVQGIIRYQKIKHLYEKYERFLMPATLVLGVIIDAITFTNISIGTTLLLLSIYLIIAGGIIVFWTAYDAKKISHSSRALRYLRLASPLIIQFTFGALLSGVFIFYFFSGTVFVSWPFILALVVLMISNDVFRHYFLKPVVQVSVYFFILFSCLSIIFPFVFNSLDRGLFLLSGALSLALIAFYILLLVFLSSDLRKERLHFISSILTIFVVLNAMYFLNVIPPIPLSIREATVSHGISRLDGAYVLHIEPQSAWERFIPGQVFHKAPGESVSVYTAIFAPGTLHTRVIHHWKWYDEAKGEWVTKSQLPFEITGGRREGFRGFSTKTNVPAGDWRVSVETERGQVLGRVEFRVVEVGEVPVLEERVK